MMHTLYLTHVPDRRPDVRVIRAVREALRTLGLDSTYREADKLLDCHARDGHALLGTSPDPRVLAEVTASLAEVGCEAVMDFDPEDTAQRDELTARRERREATRADREAERTPEEVFAERAPGEVQDAGNERKFKFSPQANMTAQALLVMADGNPINAAGFCFRLDHTTEDDLWEEVQESIIQTFPFVANVMAENQMRVRFNK